MRVARLLLPMLVALAAAACVPQQGASHVIDPATRQPVVQQDVPPNAPTAQPARSAAEAPPHNRGLFNGGKPQGYTLPVPVVQQDVPPNAPAQAGYQSAYAQAAPSAAEAPPGNHRLFHAGKPQGYTLDSGDKLRVVVFGQQGISGAYMVDAGGNISLPLGGTVKARGFTTRQLAREITGRLRRGYVRDPHVTVSIEAYRPFFILGEVTTPGQYPYLPNMTVENAVAVAGGFSPRAYKKTVELTRNAYGQRVTDDVPLGFPMRPGDTVVVKERWF